MTVSSNQPTKSKFLGIIKPDVSVALDDCFESRGGFDIVITDFGKKYFNTIAPTEKTAVRSFEALQTIDFKDERVLVEKGATIHLIRGGLATNGGLLILIYSL